jgi:hypothetical protein
MPFEFPPQQASSFTGVSISIALRSLGAAKSKAVIAPVDRLVSEVMSHTPIHANQIEIYFPIVQRKVLTPNDSSL